ncbi:hypothetical protein ABZS29_12080 [Kribbella sp. NPDC005582]|uniref:hypothetical protein n=1 Tax=Kribbella sp. NPDC005582 TaxID=3156893 RepID=UPI0033ABE2BB
MTRRPRVIISVLTGATVRAARQLQVVETGWAIQNRRRTRSLEGTLDALQALSGWQEIDPDRQVIAWLEGSAARGALGRGIIDEFRAALSTWPEVGQPHPATA